jgi:hypothetical protein
VGLGRSSAENAVGLHRRTHRHMWDTDPALEEHIEAMRVPCSWPPGGCLGGGWPRCSLL